ncbi:MAG TPA: thioredoxin family protein [Clostridia bacterium]|nr:thioredoxin family protein [Clostridia bacterium]
MKKLYDLNMIDNMVLTKKFVLLYFSSKGCSVCEVFGVKLEELLKNYPEIDCYKVDMDKRPEASGKFGMFALPGIIGYVHGKETIRESRYVSIKELGVKLDRYYEIIF